jgi:hypothetical protein
LIKICKWYDCESEGRNLEKDRHSDVGGVVGNIFLKLKLKSNLIESPDSHFFRLEKPRETGITIKFQKPKSHIIKVVRKALVLELKMVLQLKK